MPSSAAIRVEGGAMRVEGGDRGLPDTKRFLALLETLRAGVPPPTDATACDYSERHELSLAAALFDWSQPLLVTRAPGRLDVMGGIADYSGSLVLQMPIAEACHVAIQITRAPPPHHPLSPPSSSAPSPSPPSLRIVSLSASANHRLPSVSLPLARLLPGLHASPPMSPTRASPCAIDYEAAHVLLAGGAAGRGGREGAVAERSREPRGQGGGEGAGNDAREGGGEQGPEGGMGDARWAAYVAGALVVLAREREAELRQAWMGGGREEGSVAGVAMLVASAVPEGVGVASSAAVEVAAMMALVNALRLSINPWDVARMCQIVENSVVGAPCGIMDQMAAALARPASLLALLCRPARMQGCLPLAAHVALWGIDSGARHCVGGVGYGAVRAAAFMGLTLVNAGREASSKDVDGVIPAAPPRHAASSATSKLSCLCELDPHSLPGVEPLLPPAMLGAAFLARHSSHGDRATAISPALPYPVLAATRHPVHEHFRVRCFRALLGGDSHASYTACGLGSAPTDLIIDLVKTHMGPQGPLWGAKITGGGSGGTVCVLGDSTPAAQAAVEDVCARFATATGHRPHLFHGSSPGAAHFDHLVVRPP
ncbi:hypothetical protein CLOM_g20421 [Closterium sp. NIES-68]|nr:hypothetical protein CLOM_g20421 [Closterium sp. NIES-68]GJP71342.1 hypothetical protein CLOP_g2182 [Closterium sp. NIES-67]GJP79469.1 hypothetical protein CLOP_g9701 [Closterium sp. NIES-67]